MSRPAGSKNFSSYEKVMQLLKENDSLKSALADAKAEISSLTIKINTRADAYVRATDERDALRVLCGELVDALIYVCSSGESYERVQEVSERAIAKAQSILSGEAK